jgi:hypothetical protein
MDATRTDLAAKGIEPEPIVYPGGPTGPRTCWITDPNGYRIEVVQWPDGTLTASPEPTSPEPHEAAIPTRVANKIIRTDWHKPQEGRAAAGPG